MQTLSAQFDHRNKARLARIGKNAAIFVFSVVLVCYTVGPFLWLLSSSFQSEAEIVSIPPHWIPHEPTLDNFRAIIGSEQREVTYETRRQAHDMSRGMGYVPETARNVLPALLNSLIIAVSVVILNLLVSIPAGYAIAKIRFPGRVTAVYAILTTRFVPDIVLIVPFFLVINRLGVVDNVLSLIVTYLALTVPFTVYMLINYFESIPDELDKAARVDGCSRFATLIHVYLPLALPSLVAVVLFTFLVSWNEFLFALMLTQTTASQTLPIVVATFTSDFTVSFSFMNAAGVVAVVPPVVLALLFERYIVSGLTAGAVKG